MITLTTEQAQLIEDALENWFAQTPDTSHLDIKLFVLDTKQALSIIRAARAHEQAEQEPVAYDLTTREGCVALAIEKGFERRKLHNSDVEYFVCNSTILHSFVCEALAAPVRTKDLTDDEIEAVWIKTINSGTVTVSRSFARAVIAADREKNK